MVLIESRYTGEMHFSDYVELRFQIELFYKPSGLDIFRTAEPLVGWCVRSYFYKYRIQYQDPHSWSTGLPLWLPALPFWNQLALVTQCAGWLFCCWSKLERTIMKTDLFTLQLQSSNFWIWVGACLQFMLTFPTFRLNWKHDEPSVCTLFNFELGVPGCVKEMEAVFLSSWPTWLTLKGAPAGMWRSERVC